MRIGWNEASVLITLGGVILSALTTVISVGRRALWRRRLTIASDLERGLPSEGFEGLRAVLTVEIRESADRLELIEARRMWRRWARSGGGFATTLMVGAAFLFALALPAASGAPARPYILAAGLTLALFAMALAVRRDARAKSPSFKRAGDSTDPLPRPRPTLLSIWRWFPSGFSGSMDEGEDTITARVPPLGAGADLRWRQEAFPSQ